MKCLTTQGDVWLLRQIWNESICIHQSLTLLKSFKFQTILGKIHVIHVKKMAQSLYECTSDSIQRMLKLRFSPDYHS